MATIVAVGPKELNINQGIHNKSPTVHVIYTSSVLNYPLGDITNVHRYSIATSFYTALNRLVKKLDSWLEKNARAAAGGFKSKTKVISSPSSLEPPQDAPLWAVVWNS